MYERYYIPPRMAIAPEAGSRQGTHWRWRPLRAVTRRPPRGREPRLPAFSALSSSAAQQSQQLCRVSRTTVSRFAITSATCG